MTAKTFIRWLWPILLVFVIGLGAYLLLKDSGEYKRVDLYIRMLTPWAGLITLMATIAAGGSQLKAHLQNKRLQIGANGNGNEKTNGVSDPGGNHPADPGGDSL
jgi:hypothetical protein